MRKYFCQWIEKLIGGVESNQITSMTKSPTTLKAKFKTDTLTTCSNANHFVLRNGSTPISNVTMDKKNLP